MPVNHRSSTAVRRCAPVEEDRAGPRQIAGDDVLRIPVGIILLVGGRSRIVDGDIDRIACSVSVGIDGDLTAVRTVPIIDDLCHGTLPGFRASDTIYPGRAAPADQSPVVIGRGSPCSPKPDCWPWFGWAVATRNGSGSGSARMDGRWDHGPRKRRDCRRMDRRPSRRQSPSRSRPRGWLWAGGVRSHRNERVSSGRLADHCITSGHQTELSRAYGAA